jgi:MurNAc alpha-1-phosphate uridylyltransferase
VTSPGLPSADICAVVLAAGMGTRLRPLTLSTPKALCPVGNVPLLDLAIASVRPFAHDIAVNVHYLADAVREHLAGTDVHISDETQQILLSGGALGHLREWISGRPVLVRNCDAYLTDGLDPLLEGWDGTHPRILGVRRSGPSDFGDVQYVGACLLPAEVVAALPDAPASLNRLVWQPAWEHGDLEIVLATGEFVDCGTPQDYLCANLIASGGRRALGAG